MAGQFQSRDEVLRLAAEAVARVLHEARLTHSEFCALYGLPKRTFERFLENRGTSMAAGHARGPRTLLRQLVERTDRQLPQYARDALRRAYHYGRDTFK